MQSDNKSDDSYHKLSEQEIQNELNRLQGWTIVNGKLNRSFEFSSQNNYLYYCVSCGTKHKEVECPRCGSKLKKKVNA